MISKQNKVFILSLLAVVIVAAVIFLQPAVEEGLAPEPIEARVAIEVDGGGLAELGPVSVDADTRFTLHAVLVARHRDGHLVYYTEAPGLSEAGEAVPADALRRWEESRRRPVKVRWFTVEGRRPFVQLDSETGVDGFVMEEFLRSDWPVAWSIPGVLDAANDNHLANAETETQAFGTQRYHVRIEVYREIEDLIPLSTLRSWGVAELETHLDRFPTVTAGLPGALAPATRVFGLTQLVPPASPDTELLARIDDLARRRLAFSRASMIRDQLAAAGTRLSDLTWHNIDLTGEGRWQDGAGGNGALPGDLLRAGDRVVVLLRDRGEPGILDYDDQCLDYVRGAAVRPLRDVFSGEGQAVEWAALQENS